MHTFPARPHTPPRRKNTKTAEPQGISSRFAQPTQRPAEGRAMQIDDGVSDQLNECSRSVLDAAIEVHRHLGPGYLESTYEEALAIELEMRRIPFERQVALEVFYKDRKVCTNRLDLLVNGELVVEIKAVATVLQVHRAQVLSYLKAGSFRLGLLMNFNVARLKDGVSRLIWRDAEEYAQWRAWKQSRFGT